MAFSRVDSALPAALESPKSPDVADVTRTPRPFQEFDLAPPPLSPRWVEHGYDNSVFEQEHGHIISAFFLKSESAIRLSVFSGPALICAP